MISYNWKLSEANFTKDKGKVFSCFSCGGGSTMGYKLAGFDVIGAVDVDPKMMEIYRENHKPKYSYIESVADFKDREDLPEELYDLDILDGSPPCSSFSMAGNREKDWGKKKKFREGQAEQELDRLFFDFIDLAKRLQPKVVIAENVKGILLGNAVKYVQEIYKEFDKAGYYCQHFVLNASTMGVPQRRERVFFICLRKDLAEPFMEQVDLFLERPKLDLEFDEKPILWGEIYREGEGGERILNEGTELRRLWDLKKPTDKSLVDTAKRELGVEKFFSTKLLHKDDVSLTMPSNDDVLVLFDEPRRPNKKEVCSLSTFPQDYNFLKQKYNYVCGMSVPPIMMHRVAEQIYNQWLSKIN